MQDGTVEVSFSADLSLVRAVRHLVQALCAMARYGEEETQTFALVATEILNNSIEHGSHGPSERIRMAIVTREDVFRLHVVDPGRGGAYFAGGAADRASKPPNLEDPRGRGLFLIRSFMDDLRVTFEPGKGTVVTVEKSRNPR
jgi:anti-sigma regulatory factor (Ser/Thr protein kinase)